MPAVRHAAARSGTQHLHAGAFEPNPEVTRIEYRGQLALGRLLNDVKPGAVVGGNLASGAGGCGLWQAFYHPRLQTHISLGRAAPADVPAQASSIGPSAKLTPS